MNRDLRFIGAFKMLLLKGKIRQMMEHKGAVLGMFLYGIFVVSMIGFIFPNIHQGLTEAGEPGFLEGVGTTAAALSFSIFMTGSFWIALSNHHGTERDFLFPSPVSRKNMVAYRLRKLLLGIILLFILLASYLSSALWLGGSVPAYRLLALFTVPVLVNLSWGSFFTLYPHMPLLLEREGVKKAWGFFTRAHIILLFLLPLLSPFLLFFNICSGTTLIFLLALVFWLPVLGGYAIWGGWLAFCVLLPLMLLFCYLCVCYSQEIHIRLLSENYRPVPAVKKKWGWVAGLRNRLGGELPEEEVTGEEEPLPPESLPILSFGAGAQALRTKNLIPLLRGWKGVLGVSAFLFGMVGFMNWLAPMPIYMTFFMTYLIVLMLSTKFTRHISTEGRQLDIIKLIPDTGPRVFWNYTLPGIYLGCVLVLLFAGTFLLYYALRLGLSLAMLLFSLFLVVMVVLNSQEGFIRKMRNLESSEVLAGKQKLSWAGILGLIYGGMVFFMMTGAYIDVMWILLYLSGVFAWFIFASVLRIGNEMEEFLNPKRKRRWIKPLGLKFASLAVALLFLVVPWPYNFQDYEFEGDQGPIPVNYRHYISTTVEIENTNYTIQDNLVISGQGSVVLRNATLVLEHVESRNPPGIFVEKGGILELFDSVVRTNHSEGFRFEVYGSLQAVNSSFLRPWGDKSSQNEDGGLELYSSDVLLQNCSVENGRTNGILIAKSEPRIENCTITGCGDDGIEINQASPVIANTIISDNGWGVVIFRGSPVFINCTIARNQEDGFSVAGSTTTLLGCQVVDNGDYGVSLLQGKLIQENSVISNNSGSIRDSDHYCFLNDLFC